MTWSLLSELFSLFFQTLFFILWLLWRVKTWRSWRRTPLLGIKSFSPLIVWSEKKTCETSNILLTERLLCLRPKHDLLPSSTFFSLSLSLCFARKTYFRSCKSYVSYTRTDFSLTQESEEEKEENTTQERKSSQESRLQENTRDKREKTAQREDVLKRERERDFSASTSCFRIIISNQGDSPSKRLTKREKERLSHGGHHKKCGNHRFQHMSKIEYLLIYSEGRDLSLRFIHWTSLSFSVSLFLFGFPSKSVQPEFITLWSFKLDVSPDNCVSLFISSTETGILVL